MLVSVQHVTKGFLDKTVLSGVSLDIQENDRIGLLGVNGAGKTTLLNLITGALEPDDGTIVRARDLEIGYLRQNDALVGERTLDEEAREAFSAAARVQQKLEACWKALEADPANEELLTESGRLSARLDALDAYHIDAKIDRVLTGLGFSGFDRSTLVSTLSGGEKMRFGIAKMLLKNPDLLILDEPTNHLDFSMLGWLEDYLSAYKGAVLVVSHDRYFLDHVAQDICEVERHRLTRYKGGYTGFVQQKAERRRAALRAFEKQQEEIAAMEEYVRRNLVRASTTKMAQSRRNTLENMERLEKPPPQPRTISLQFSYDVEPFTEVLTCENLGVRVGQGESSRLLYSGLALTVQRGEKIALVGLNGVGKSTFLKAIQELIPHDGLVRWGGNVRLGYFDQELAGLDMDAQVLDAVHSRYPTKTEYEIRSVLGRLLISGEDVYKKVRELSGANRAKVAFAILLMHRANVLLLDEPTNHLDYRAKEALEEALRAFTGTLLVVSHDRYFLRQVPGRILEMRPEGFVSYPGNYDAYREAKSAEGVQQAAAVAEKKQQAKPTSAKARRAEEAQRRTRTKELEREIDRLEGALAETNTALQDPQNASDYEKLSALSEALHRDTALLDEVMEEWLAFTSEEE